MKLHHAISVVAVIAQASAARSPSFHSDLSEWKACSDAPFTPSANPTGTKAECAVYNAPLCYHGICKAPKHVNSTVDIFVKRILAVSNPDTSSNLWVLQGTNGASSADWEATVLDIHSGFNGKVNVYTMDHRGTGRSTLLDCVTMPVTTTGYLSSDIYFKTSQVPACAHALEKKYGDLSSFSITSAATDVATFISDFSNGMNTIVCGMSFGTVIVERLIHLNPHQVTGYVLDGVFTTSGAPRDKTLYTSAGDTNFGKVGDTFMALCETDSVCSKRFARKSLRATLQDVLTHFDENPKSTCAALVSKFDSDQSSGPASYILRQTLGILLQEASMRTLIAPLVYRLNRCEAKDVDVLTYFFVASNASNSQVIDDSASYILLYYLVSFSEMWERPTPSMKEMTLRFTNVRMAINPGGHLDIPLYCAFSKEKSAVCDQLGVGNYDGKGIVYAVDKHWNTSAKIPPQASVLLLSSKLDAQTPHKFAKSLLNVLGGGKKELITFKDSVHWAILSTPLGQGGETCGMKLLVSYVTNDGDLKRLDKSCVDEMPAFNMTPPLVYQYYFLRTEDIYDGVINGSLIDSVATSGSSTNPAELDEYQD